MELSDLRKTWRRRYLPGMRISRSSEYVAEKGGNIGDSAESLRQVRRGALVEVRNRPCRLLERTSISIKKFIDYCREHSVVAAIVESYKNPETKRAAADNLRGMLSTMQNAAVQALVNPTQELFYMLRRLPVGAVAGTYCSQISRCCVNEGEADLPGANTLLTRVSAYNEKLKQLQIHDRPVSLSESIHLVVPRKKFGEVAMDVWRGDLA